jgi:tetratricopeptide (TPR) repeat protein
MTTARSSGSTTLDGLGNPMTGSAEAIATYDQAVAALLQWELETVPLAERLVTEHAEAPMAHAFMGYLCMSSSEETGVAPARGCWEALGATTMNVREQAHHDVLGRWISGDWKGAADRADQLLAAWPTDLLALIVGHQLDFFQGDATNLRDRVARTLFELDPEHPTTSLVEGMYAFGLEESGDLARAEEVGLGALARQPRDPWGIHAVTHVHEMRGRADQGIRFLVERKGDWAADNLLKVHNWWHLAVFELEAGNVDEALRMYDAEIDNEQSEGVALEMLDAASLLWRLHLDGVDVGDRFSLLADSWTPVTEARPWYAFNDLHAALAYAGAGRVNAAEKVAERLASYVHADGDGTNVTMTAEVGLPATRAVVRFAQGRYDDAVQELLPIRRTLQRFGGSHAQRDVLQRTLLEAAIRGGQTDLARSLTAERLTARATSTYGWLQRARVLTATGDTAGAEAAGRHAEQRKAIVQAAALEAELEQDEA